MRNRRSKVLIVESNCAQLIALTVWLAQFQHLQVSGSLSRQDLKESADSKGELEYDLIIYGLEINSSEELSLELSIDLSLIRKIKSHSRRPAVILLTHYLNDNKTDNVAAQILSQLLRECDTHFSADCSLIDFQNEINRLLNYEQLAMPIPAIAR